ncbi:MAG TPA: metalloregulator ArsR/SmtB family transcription factor [Myxococcota bacterium]|nr:metalloregulator ArsR/SmtB family transcription factor [Myxococcota bacterium]HPB51532.1 metalloregulator ArsR/SmtB family transcription factor [Myxococcota bacterium]HQP96504.1 metalloregulator ArsR/SmtB family transcription factor [Myxococcota bacterium]
MRRAADFYKALSDEARLGILLMLHLHGELCVCDIMGALGITQSKASRHLANLRHAGLVTDRREGQWSHYRIRQDLADFERVALMDAMNAVVALDASRELIEALNRQLRAKRQPSVCGDDVRCCGG